MSQLEWKFKEPLEDENIIENFETEYGYQINDKLKEFLIKNNGGIPNKRIFDSPRQGLIISNLLSFNKDGEETVYMVLKNFQENGKLSMLPFATDGFGNFICIKNDQIVLWNHESDLIEKIADSLGDFLNMLHD